MATGLYINYPWRRSVENGAAFSTTSFVAKVTLTPALSRGERGLAEQAFIYFSPGTLAISRRTLCVGATVLWLQGNTSTPRGAVAWKTAQPFPL